MKTTAPIASSVRASARRVAVAYGRSPPSTVPARTLRVRAENAACKNAVAYAYGQKRTLEFARRNLGPR